MSERLARTAFFASALALAATAGVAIARNDVFPNPQITAALATLGDLREHWRNDLELEPTRHLVPAATHRRSQAEEFRVHRPEAIQPGYTLISGLSREQESSAFEVGLYDTAGRVLHRWPVRYSDLDPEGPKPLHTMLHGLEVFPDGSIAVAFDAGRAIARLDPCGEPIWVARGGFHHSITADGAGGLWAWRDETIVRLDAATGAETRRLDLRADILPAAGGQHGVFAIRSFAAGPGKPLAYPTDPFHANDVEPLLPEMAAAFPQFEAGDLLVSLREANLVAVIDPDDGRLRWWQHGPWLKQHDPDFQPDGTISVYDNHTGSDSSRILAVDPKTRALETLFAGTDETPFYSWQRGKHQRLPNGNLLVTESEHGRVLEVAPDGGLVWERDMGWDADRNMVVTEARHVAPDFFDGALPTCTVTASRGAPARNGPG
jgi:Arylsulfotransferase (ASST)